MRQLFLIKIFVTQELRSRLALTRILRLQASRRRHSRFDFASLSVSLSSLLVLSRCATTWLLLAPSTPTTHSSTRSMQETTAMTARHSSESNTAGRSQLAKLKYFCGVPLPTEPVRTWRAQDFLYVYMEFNGICFPPALTTSLTTTSNTSTRWTSRGSPSVTLSAPKNWQTNMFRSSILISDLFAKNSFFHSCTNKEKLHFFWNVCSGFQFWSFPRTRPPRS